MYQRQRIGEVESSALSEQAAATLKSLALKEDGLSFSKAMSLARRIRPIISGNNPEDLSLNMNGKPQGQKFWVKSSAIHNGSYVTPIMAMAPAKGLTEIGEIETYHECSACGSFRPSVFEVLYQIPEELREKVSAFELYTEDGCWLNIYDAETDRQKFKCILYAGSIPQEVKNSPVSW